MSFFQDLFRRPPFERQHKAEVEKLLDELVRVGREEDFLSERPGGSFNGQCHHIRARQIGKRLHEIGGLELMHWVAKRVRRKLGVQLGTHLEYAWNEIGGWVP